MSLGLSGERRWRVGGEGGVMGGAKKDANAALEEGNTADMLGLPTIYVARATCQLAAAAHRSQACRAARARPARAPPECRGAP